MDPLFEKTGTPYQYTYQNPIKFTDPTGMAGESIDNDYKLGSDGKITLDKVTNDESDRLIAENGDVISSNIKKGILSDGINIKNNGLEIQGLNKEESFEVEQNLILPLSIYEIKEISFGEYEHKTFPNMYNKILFIAPYKDNDFSTSAPMSKDYVRKAFIMDLNYKLTLAGHVHPSFGFGYGDGRPSDADVNQAKDANYSNNLILGRNGWSKYTNNGSSNVKLNSYNNKLNYTENYILNTLKWKKRLF